jgi:hypothetical protein
MADFSALGFEGTAPVQLANLAQKQGQADLSRAQAEKIQLENQQTKALQSYLQQAAAGMGGDQAAIPGITGDNDMPRMLEGLSMLSARFGNLKDAGELAVHASQIRSHAATAYTQQIEAEKKTREIQWDQITKLDQILSIAKDQDSFDHANAIYAGVFGKPSPYAGQKYEDVQPQLEALGQQILTAKERIQLDLQKQDVDSKSKNRKSAIEFRDFRKGIMAEEQDLRAGRETRLNKNSGKVIGAPTKQEVDLVYPMVNNSMKDLDAEEKYQKAGAVAGMARKLMRDHPGLDFDTAARQALMRVSKIPGVTYQDGKTPSQPLPLPADRKLEMGHYYMTTKGVGKATKDGIELLPTGIEFDKMFNGDMTNLEDAE